MAKPKNQLNLFWKTKTCTKEQPSVKSSMMQTKRECKKIFSELRKETIDFGTERTSSRWWNLRGKLTAKYEKLHILIITYSQNTKLQATEVA